MNTIHNIFFLFSYYRFCNYMRLNMRITLLLFLLVFSSIISQSKTIIKGKVRDNSNYLQGANISIKGTYDGTTSKSGGEFEFKTLKKGKAELVIKYIGYYDYIKEIELIDTTFVINAILKAKVYRTDAVSVTAGSIEATDEKKSVVFSSLDIVSTAGSGADIVTAFQTLPGVSKVGESGGLFVRGGEGKETAIFIDGVEVKHPFYSKTPDLASRGRFSPFLFKGTYFSTGGYSAEFGKGLSSAMILNTTDLPDYSFTHIDLMPLGLGFGHTYRGDKFSIGADIMYSNLKWYFDLNPQDQKWTKSPVGYEGNINSRYKTSETGLLKAIVYFGSDEMALEYKDFNNDLKNSKYSGKNLNILSNISYKEMLNENWQLNSAVSYANNKDKTNYNDTNITNSDSQIMLKGKLSYFFGELSTLNFGGEFSNYYYKDSYFQYNQSLNNNLSTLFIEPEFGINKDLVIRVGLRTEYSSINDRMNLAPRLSAAYRVSQFGTLSFAGGRFFQLPEKEYLQLKRDLGFEIANHYIMNYQYLSDLLTFRAEIYYKKYDKLISTNNEYNTDGYGYAKGIDIFWRDRQSIPNFDYWISYSYLDTKRKYLDYPIYTEPDFAVNHSASIVTKKYFPDVHINIAATYSYSSGRMYDNPLSDKFMNSRTKDYHNLSLSAYYLTELFGAFTVFIVSVDNVLGIDNIYTVKYTPDGRNQINIKPGSLRNIFFGVFLSFGRDNSDDY